MVDNLKHQTCLISDKRYNDGSDHRVTVGLPAWPSGRAYLSEHEVEFADSESEERLDFSHMGAVLAHAILTLAYPVAGRAR